MQNGIKEKKENGWNITTIRRNTAQDKTEARNNQICFLKKEKTKALHTEKTKYYQKDSQTAK